MDAVTAAGPAGTVMLDAPGLTTRELNQALRALPAGATVTITEPRGRHNLAVGLASRICVTIDGNAGYYVGGLGDGPDITVNGFTGWGIGENLMAGSIRVKGSVSQSAAASAHGGLVVVEGDASLRAGISLKGGTLAIAGDAGNLTGFMAQAGTILIGGDAGEALGDSLYEARLYVRGSVTSLGADCVEKEMRSEHLDQLRELLDLAGIDDVEAEDFRRYGSARQLYNFHIDNVGSY